MMVIMAAGAAIDQHQKGKARDAAQDAADEQSKLAREAEENQLAALDEQLAQETDKTEVAKLERTRQALRERAKIRVAASESGAFGNVTIKELSAAHIGEGYDRGILDYNLRATADQIARQQRGVRTTTKRDIASQKAGIPLSTPTWMQGLNIGLAGAKGYFAGGGAGGSGAGTTTSTATPRPHIPAL
jgi:hypothetical protein